MSDLDLSKPVRARQESFFAFKIATLSGVARDATSDGSPCAARLKRQGWVSPRGDTPGDTRKPPETMLNVRGCARVVLEVGSNLVQQTRLVEIMVGFTNQRRRARRERGVVVDKTTLIYERHNTQEKIGAPTVPWSCYSS